MTKDATHLADNAMPQRPPEARPVRVGDRIRYRGWNKGEWPSGHEVTAVRPHGLSRTSNMWSVDVRREHIADWMHADGTRIDAGATFAEWERPRTDKAPPSCAFCGCNTFGSNERAPLRPDGTVERYWTCLRCGREPDPCSANASPAAVGISSGEVCWTLQREIDRATDETRPGLLVAYKALLDLTSRRAHQRDDAEPGHDLGNTLVAKFVQDWRCGPDEVVDDMRRDLLAIVAAASAPRPETPVARALDIPVIRETDTRVVNDGRGYRRYAVLRVEVLESQRADLEKMLRPVDEKGEAGR